MRHRHPVFSSRVVAIGLASVLVLAACGGSDDDDDDGASAGGEETSEGVSSEEAESTGPTRFKVMVIGAFSSPSLAFNVPEAVPSVKAAMKEVDGVEVSSCDSGGDANALTECQRKAVADGVTAVVYAFGNQGQDILNEAGIPVIGVTDTTSPTSYAFASGAALYAAVGVGLAKAGCDRLGILYLDGTDSLVDYVQGGMESEGGEEVARAPIAVNAPDLTAAIGKLTGAKADCIALSVVPNQVAQAVVAVKQTGQDLLMAGVSAIFTDEVLESLGDASEGMLIVDGQINVADKHEGVDKYKKALAAVDDDAEPTQQGLTAYVSGRYLAAALATIEGVGTPETVRAALEALRDVEIDGVVSPLSSVELANKDFPRLFNAFGITYKITNGRPKKSGTFYELGPILEAVS